MRPGGGGGDLTEICRAVDVCGDGPDKKCRVQWFWRPIHLEGGGQMPDNLKPGPNGMFPPNSCGVVSSESLVQDVERCNWHAPLTPPTCGLLVECVKSVTNRLEGGNTAMAMGRRISKRKMRKMYCRSKRNTRQHAYKKLRNRMTNLVAAQNTL